MTSRAVPLPPVTEDLAELLRQSLAGFLPPAPLAHLLDRLEGAR
jgi:hypothetical protein